MPHRGRGHERRFVSALVEPMGRSDEVLEEVKSAAKTFLGRQAEAVNGAERGYAYGSASKSEAAAIAGGRVYRVEVGSAGSATIGDMKAATVQILEKVIR